MSAKVRFGLIGCGMIANFHAAAIKDIQNAVLNGCADVKPEFAKAFADKHGIAAYDSPQSLMDSGAVDAVCICTPSGLHAEYAIAAAKRGLNVVVEKPMALTAEECDSVIEAVKQNGIKLAVISQLRFSPAIRAVKSAIAEGKLGKLVTANLSMNYFRSAEYYANGGWRGTWKMDGGGALMNQGIHGVDLMLYLMGETQSVEGFKQTLLHNIEVEDTAAGVISFASGALGTIVATTACYSGNPRRLEICGTKGCVTLEEDTIVKWQVESADKPELETASKTNSANDPTAINHTGHKHQLTDFIDAIKQNREPLVNAAEGKRAVYVIRKIYNL